MAGTMRSQIIKIGNSQGVRVPRAILEQAGLEGDVDIEVRDGAIVIRPAAHPREGWAAAFADMAKHGDDFILDADTTAMSSWDEEEWNSSPTVRRALGGARSDSRE